MQYHFGTKEELLKAIVRYRTENAQDRARAALDELEATGRQHDVRGLLEAALVPLVTSQPAGSNYLRFVVAPATAWCSPTSGARSASSTAPRRRRISGYLDEALAARARQVARGHACAGPST